MSVYLINRFQSYFKNVFGTQRGLKSYSILLSYGHLKEWESTDLWLQIPVFYTASMHLNLSIAWVGQQSLHRGVCCLAISPTGKDNATLRVCTVVQLRDEPTVQILFCLRSIKNFVKLSWPQGGSDLNKSYIAVNLLHKGFALLSYCI